MKINWKVRWNNPVWWIQIALAVFAPILTYFGVMWNDLTTWNAIANLFIDAIKNPVVFVSVVVSIFNAINDPTTRGLSDSGVAQRYSQPR